MLWLGLFRKFRHYLRSYNKIICMQSKGAEALQYELFTWVIIYIFEYVFE